MCNCRQGDDWSVVSMKVIDVKRLHRVLIEELAAVQGSSTVAQRQLILREIQVCFILPNLHVFLQSLECTSKMTRYSCVSNSTVVSKDNITN